MLRGPDREEARDGGMSVIELITAMGIFTVVLAVFLGGLVTMARGTTRATQVADTSDSLRATFQAMDRQIRYASSINRPGTGASGAWYVEFIATELPDSQDPLCTQWRFDPTAQTLAYRTWRDTPSSTVTPWHTAAHGVSYDSSSGQRPFTFTPASGTHYRQQLTVVVNIGPGAVPGAEVTGDVSTVFVARNSSETSPSNPDANGDGASDAPVCTSHLSRP